MGNRIAAAALQYSKWLSRFICWFWAIYRVGVLAVAAIRPDAAGALASTLINLDWIMLVNEGTYLINSLGEKYIYSDRFILKWLDKGGFQALAKKLGLMKFDNPPASESEDEESEEDEDEDGGDEDDTCG